MDETRRELIDLGIIDERTIEPFYPRVRDRDDVAVLRDASSGVIFLDRSDHMDITHYETITGGAYWSAKDRADALEKYREDDERRAAQFRDLIRGKRVIDIGCGTGGFLDRIRDTAASTAGIEPQTSIREELVKLGYDMYRIPEETPPERYDVATLFHVLEHITTPLATLKATRALLADGGTVVVEVPHARDTLFALEAFKRFSLWSEHLVLHTKESLRRYLEAAGFRHIEVQGFQRYPLANHLTWLVEGTPGGQHLHPELNTASAAAVYEKFLVQADRTDTLIATALR